MTKWMRRAAAAAVAVAIAAGGAQAADDQYGRSGPFLGIGVDYSFEDFSGGASSPAPDDSWGYDIDAGYRFNEYFALQIGWQDFVSFDDGGDDVRFWMVGLDAKFYPFHGMVQPYLLAGAGYSDADDSRGGNDDGYGFAGRFGAGFDFYLTRNWALNTEVGYVLPSGDAGDYASIPLSFGVLYRFY